jgi:putative peptidoglycan lipid II flippase
LITVPAAAGLVICATPIYSQLFMSGAFTFNDVNQTALALAAYAPGLLFVGISRVVVPTFYAMNDTKTPVWVSFWTLFVNVACGLLLMQHYQHIGLAFALTLSSIFNAIILLLLLQRRLGGMALGGVVVISLKVFAATAVMASIVHSVLAWGDWQRGLTAANLLVLGGAICCGLISYALCCYLLKIKEVRDVVALVKKRLKR